jgi:hypothetical protein
MRVGVGGFVGSFSREPAGRILCAIFDESIYRLWPMGGRGVEACSGGGCGVGEFVYFGYRWPKSTRPVSPARSPLFGPGPSPAR